MVVVRIRELPEQQRVFAQVAKAVFFLRVDSGLRLAELYVLLEGLGVKQTHTNDRLEYGRKLNTEVYVLLLKNTLY